MLQQPINKEKRQRYNLPEDVFNEDNDDYDRLPQTLNENSFGTLEDNNINNQTSHVMHGKSSQIAVVLDDERIQQLQLPNSNHPEASEHEITSEVEQINYVKPADTLVDMTQHEPPSQIMQNNHSQMDIEEPLLFQDCRDAVIDAQGQLSNDAQLTNTQLVKEIAINRNNVLKDMITAFKDEEVLFINYNNL
ncbi:uncharacterized protein LOC114542880 [Dendronephthya gigantea]|uniref:uncharacterized protein LOC114542880 n=1 Tax=Dendronephthya gigantea TaxID=151771 RepID=UPI00106CAFE8|nr:uncharacterized protein LOC114542880 [Dendronephthya gigantea]